MNVDIYMVFAISHETVDPSRLMASFSGRMNAVVVGASGGIGSAVVQQLTQSPRVAQLLALSKDL